MYQKSIVWPFLHNSTKGTYQQRNMQAHTIQRKVSSLPPQLKSGIEGLSGLSMKAVRVHYNSPKPSQLQAYAYTQGNDIYLAPGQEHHLPHEAWHVVQQAQGRVKPTVRFNGQNINDNPLLEREADIMGQRALSSNRWHR
jgi:hypothetical protein